MNNIAAVVLAAGKGKRMKTLNLNKVVLKVANKHMIVHIIDLLEKIKIRQIMI